MKYHTYKYLELVGQQALGVSLAGVVESHGPNRIQSCVEGEINVGLKGNHWIA